MPWQYARHAQPAKEYGDVDLTLENEFLPLGPVGMEQARELAAQQHQFHVIFHSSFARAKETANIVYKVQGSNAQLVELPQLAEVRFGHPDRTHLKEWINTGMSDGGETVSMARERVQYVRERALALGTGIRGLIVAHKLLYSVFLLDNEGQPLTAPVAALRANQKLEYAQCVELSF